MRRLSVLAVVTLLGSLLFTSAAASAAVQIDEVDWEPCYQQIGPFECAQVRVPLDYASPRSGNIRVSVVRLPASDPANRLGAIFFNPGGPGGSGVDFVVGAGPFLYTDELRAHFDFVGFDPRGILRSSPLTCFGSIEESFSVAPPWAFPFGRAQERFQAALDMALDAACQANARAIIDHMSTANVARDIATIADHMGEEQINYAGYSYGSFLGVSLVNLFPDRVRAVVVDGVLDPIAWTTGTPGSEDLPFSTRLRSDVGAQATLDEFFRLCDEAGPDCAFAGDSAARYAAMADVLRQGPLEVVDPGTGDTFVITYADLIGNSLGAMYDSASWPFLALFLADVEALLGTNRAPTGSVAAARDALLEATSYAERASRYPNVIEGFVGVACSDSDNPDRHRFWSIAGAEADAAHGYFGRLWTWASSPCAVWRGFDDGRSMGPFTAETSNPVLVVGNLYDPATPYHGALAVRDLLPNSSLLTLDGWGHVSAFLSQCADTAVADYLLTGVPPADGTVCTQDVGPFDEPIVAGEPADAAEVRAKVRREALRDVAYLPPSLVR
jgi:pimeloyl-ACP methyl ester carboxylesterase